MYTPRHFLESDIPTLHAAIRRHGFATLVSMTPDGLLGTHLPLLLDPDAGPYGTLIGHIARANPHGRLADPAVQTMAIFQGPDGYITPSWYEAKAETGKVVPTWNYVAIHAYGPLEMFDDPARLLDVVTRLTDRHEGARAKPWAVSDAPADFIDGMLKGIVGIALPIVRLEGKAKLSQNRPAPDQARVIAGLREDGRDALAEAMAAVRPPG
jgi:transcriptional regulator